MKKYKLNISEEPHSKDLESIGSIFIPLIKNMMTTEDLVGVDIILNWHNIIGEAVASYCNPIKTKYDQKENKRILYVEVPAGGFALEIQHKEKYMLDKINAYIGYQAVHKLNISQNMNMQPKVISTKNDTQDKEIELTEKQKIYLQNVAQEIKDENLRKILIKIGQNVLANQKE